MKNKHMKKNKILVTIFGLLLMVGLVVATTTISDTFVKFFGADSPDNALQVGNGSTTLSIWSENDTVKINATNQKIEFYSPVSGINLTTVNRTGYVLVVAPVGTPADYNTDASGDQTEIRNAIDALGPFGGGTVIIREGYYSTSGFIEIKSSEPNVTIIGAGKGTHIEGTGNFPIIETSGKYTVIKDIYVSGVGDGGGSNNDGIRLASGSDFSEVSGVWVSAVGQAGFQITSSFNKVHDNTVFLTGSDSVFADCYQIKGDNNLLTNNVCEDAEDSCIEINFGDFNFVEGNYCFNTDVFSSIMLRTSLSNVISNNYIYGSDNSGVEMFDKSHGNMIIGNYIDTQVESDEDAIHVCLTCNNNTIMNNFIVNWNSYGIGIDGSANNTVVIGNVMQGSTHKGFVRDEGVNTVASNNLEINTDFYNLTIGTSANPINTTMYSPDGSQFECGVDNSGGFNCV